MHGEMFYYILDAFTHFDRFYVWNEYYRDLSVSLRCKSEFIITRPDSINIDLDSIDIHDSEKYDIKYYLQMQDGAVLQNIANSLNEMHKAGYSVCVRYHPRTVNLDEIMKLMPDIILENPKECSIEKSIKTADYIVGLNSTVLFQAYSSGCKVIIDDVSNKDLYEKLKEMQYMLIGKCTILSAFLKGNNDESISSNSSKSWFKRDTK